MSERLSRAIQEGRTALGIELGSSRIKAILLSEDLEIIAQGGFNWENSLVDGIWTYDLKDVWHGIQEAFSELSEEIKRQYNIPLKTIGAIGISAMMHGYLPFNERDELLVPFRTWRNTITEHETKILIEKFDYNIPQRWSIAHLYHAILQKEKHVSNIKFITTLAGYVHWQLTGQKVLGIGDASGMFPIDDHTRDYNEEMLKKFDQLIAKYQFPWQTKNILPKVLKAGAFAGTLTEKGAALLDPSGTLQAGIIMAPPEGDAGTGMVATNSILPRTGNVSAGTSIFGMVVLERALSKVHVELDMVTTPSGSPVAMVHCNNCTSDLDAWVRVFSDLMKRLDLDVKKPALYDALYFSALDADQDCDGIVAFNYVSGEHLTGFSEGRPLVVRKPDANFTLPNFMRTMINSTLATLRIGMDILTEEEHVAIDKMLGHGGLFKTEKVGQMLMANALKVPIAVMESAGEGGAWGMAILAQYAKDQENLSLEDYLEKKVFVNEKVSIIAPNVEDMASFDRFLENFKKSFAVQKSAVDALPIQ